MGSGTKYVRLWRPALSLFALGVLTCFFSTMTYAQTRAACMLEDLKCITEKYFTALEAHNPAGIPLDAKVRYTENGQDVQVGKGIWETAQKTLLKRTVIDTEKCGTHSQAVLQESNRPILFGVRLKIEGSRLLKSKA